KIEKEKLHAPFSIFNFQFSISAVPARLLLERSQPMVTFEKAPPEALQLLPVPIRELGLRLETTPLAPLIEQLYAELDRAGLRHFRPLCYLSDQWGCPSGQPVIGIPWYLADPRAAQLENALNDLENEREMMMYL